MRLVAALTAISALIWAAAASAHNFPSYDRVACLGDRQQVPIARLGALYPNEDDPGTPEDESETFWEYGSTAVAISPGYWLTASHSVSPAPAKIVLYLADGSEREATRIAVEPVNDISLLSASTEALDLIPIHTGPLRPGIKLWVLGYPTLTAVSLSGSLISVTGGRLLMGAPIFQGMSGGPVIICGESGPEIAGLINSFNYYRYGEYLSRDEDGKLVVERWYINDGTSNGPGNMMLIWFSELAIRLYEE